MGRIAVDVVLLPNEEMTDRAIEANRELVSKFGEKIVLNKENYLPHISLAMGCIDEKDIVPVEEILRAIAKEKPVGQLQVTEVSVSINTKGETVSVFSLEKTEELQSLHEEVMRRLQPYLSSDVTAEMVNAAEVSKSSLSWIKDYAKKASFARFEPHITIGYGQIDQIKQPVRFQASRLALCHLGNNCTCTKILAAIDI